MLAVNVLGLSEGEEMGAENLILKSKLLLTTKLSLENETSHFE
jgi:hypothetical protein